MSDVAFISDCIFYKMNAHDNNNTNIYGNKLNLFRINVKRNQKSTEKSMRFPVFNTF